MAGAEEFKKGLSQLIDYATAHAATLSPQAKAKFAEFLRNSSDHIRQLEQEVPTSPPVTPVTPDDSAVIPDTARLLWVAAGGDPDIFVSFLGTYPDSGLDNIKRNPHKLAHIIRTLSTELPRGEPTSRDGIVSSPIPSSNVWGFGYDKNTGKMRVKFNGKNVKDAGPMYEYDNVPPEIAAIIAKGGIPARTSGKNRWGKWWRGKTPSIAASVNALLVKGGYSFRRLN